MNKMRVHRHCLLFLTSIRGTNCELLITWPRRAVDVESTNPRGAFYDKYILSVTVHLSIDSQYGIGLCGPVTGVLNCAPQDPQNLSAQEGTFETSTVLNVQGLTSGNPYTPC